MENIYIVDAVNYLFRSYYAIGPMLNHKGLSTSALYGFIRSIHKLLKDFSPGHFVVVFDGPDNKKSRLAVYADYKMHRKEAPSDLYPQFKWAYEWCEMAGLSTLCVEGVEADDTMAAVATWAARQGADVYLCSSDKDLMQLVNDKVFVVHAHKDNLLINAEKVEELFGVRPDQMLDYLAIVGDASDNIPGIPGFGPKTASALLAELGALDVILAHPEKIKGEKKQQILRANKSQALMSRELATLNLSVEVPKNETFYEIKEIDRNALTEFYHRMKFLSLLRDMGEIKTSSKKPEKHLQAVYHFIDEEEELKRLFEKLAGQRQVCIDTETTSVSPMTAALVGIGFGLGPKEAWYVPRNGKLGEKTISLLKAFFQSSQCSFFGHNIKYDLHVLENEGIHLSSISFDTLIASYLLNPQNRRHGLDELALEKFKKIKTPIADLIGKGKQQISMMDVEIQKVSAYCCEDVDYTIRLKELFEKELEEKNLTKLLSDIEIPLLPILAKMERTGIYLDVEQLKQLGANQLHQLEHLRQKIFQEAKAEFNLNSPKQLSEILFVKMGFKQPFRKKTEFSTGADVLEALAVRHPIAKLLLDYRGLEKLRSTYIEALPTSVLPRTQRIHCTFSQSVAATGRLSCQNPNLQNIPVRSNEGLAIRRCFKPERPSWSYIGADYSQIELRLLAHFSKDEELIRAFSSGQDIHTHTASLVYDIPPSMVTSEMRDAAKTVNFGIIYGQGPFGLSKQLGISIKEASDFIKKYFNRYPKISDYLESCKTEARKMGFVTTLTGRQRPIPEIHNKNPAIRSAAERLAVNTPLQGTAADLIKMAMIEIDRELESRKLESKMILQIHDELIFEAPDPELETMQKIVKEKMEGVLSLNVPIVVQMAVGKNWAEC
ncbi:MAG TPA: DNA polymerase I [Chlamydiales bacterium]|nr:DNA polymerase I [Chlamydiales bacterium]